jgi:FkbM family methyltransferase
MEFLDVEYPRERKANLNEGELIHDLLSSLLHETDSERIMFDVGANIGNSLDIYLSRGWKIYAFEPDPNNRDKLLELYGSNPRLHVSPCAISLVDGDVVSFYASEESTGISSLSPFTEGHQEIATVETLRLDTFILQSNVNRVDFLKIDVEGHDFFALQSFPFNRLTPEAIIVEYEDKKTQPLGYTVHDMANFLIANSYHVWVSEWHPITRYGIAHDWRRLVRYKPSLDLQEGWGNLMGFRSDLSDQDLGAGAALRVRFGFGTSFGIQPRQSTELVRRRSLSTLARFLVRLTSSISRPAGVWLNRFLRRVRRRLVRWLS